ncbi:NAD(P)-dependent oxidoreductase [Hydrogenophaga laconesensis]|uniref:3-hydroxyisobutyrate dehydrogenase-like beta-hydroxyacid dehydrogenase n=1 Tax=Hydrogenophaga laconesensis TaxID=1805971 RepID=A0ABU1VHN1_9BURK|nr:NAD(P)-dependent oxidoreductase [Hydrogenophaga laconesensis]MDR7096991.1 3-hydroxyisobutyrate dehydrogenase-like beta-hydroxyacid dehydrogenase [Hydrogenophaga laconesensis]
MSTKKPASSAASTVRATASRSPRSTAPAPSPARQRVGVVGLGIMGSAMAGNLRKDGFDVWGFDPSPAARKALKAMGGTVCKSATELAGLVDVVITSLPGPAAMRDAASDLAAGARKGLVVIETSTLDIDDKAQARDVLAKAGAVLLDCPLSGTGAQAAAKDLTIYASGPAAAIRKVEPVFKGFTSAQFNLGAFGNGMKMKLMANLLVAIHNVSTAEALLLGQRWGISPGTAVKVLAGGAGGSRMLQVRGPQMENEGWKTVTMKIAVWQKDMKLIAAALKETGVPAPLFAATVPLYDAAMGMGHGLHDTAAVFDVLDRMSRPAA